LGVQLAELVDLGEWITVSVRPSRGAGQRPNLQSRLTRERELERSVITGRADHRVVTGQIEDRITAHHLFATSEHLEQLAEVVGKELLTTLRGVSVLIDVLAHDAGRNILSRNRHLHRDARRRDAGGVEPEALDDPTGSDLAHERSNPTPLFLGID